MEKEIKRSTPCDKVPLSPADLEHFLELIRSTKFGSVTVVIQDGYVVQIDRNEKVRLK